MAGLHVGPRGHRVAGPVAKESCRLLDRAPTRPPAADPASLRAGALSGPGKGAAGGDGRGGWAPALEPGVMLPVSRATLPYRLWAGGLPRLSQLVVASACLGLWLHHSNHCLCLFVAFSPNSVVSLCVSYKDASYWI